jgi:Cobalamin biosynthesis protein CobT (nicotinate-mononucleotide:5, 6-dimethylbenzimidazole phosphoribosyltransferase)
MEPTNQSKSGRTRVPTKRYQSYVDDCNYTKDKKRARKEEAIPADGQINDASNRSERDRSLKANNAHSSNKVTGKGRNYVCQNCGISMVCSSPQEFIKLHQVLPGNEDCYERGLAHCPNKECTKKVFLSEKDLMRHVSMKESSKTNKCLQRYRETRAFEALKVRHATSQVSFSTIPSAEKNNALPRGYGTLLNHDTGGDPQAGIIYDFSTVMPGTSEGMKQHTLTSDLHIQNVLIAQEGEYSESFQQNIQRFRKSRHIDSSLHHGTIPNISSTGHKSLSSIEMNDTDFPHDLELEDEYSNTATNVDKLMRFRSRLNEATSYWNSTFTREDKACMQLEGMLRKANAPLHLYDDIMQWACLNKHSIPSHVPPISRNSLYSQLSRKMHGDMAEEMKPKHVPTILPSGRHCTISVFNIYSQITQLLVASNINNWENYFFSPIPGNPFHLNLFSDWTTDQFDGIETGLWYKRTHDQVIQDGDNEILVPICLFIDGTVLSLSGSLSLEPVMFSLMIHNRKTRHSHEAWLPLGYIHDPSNLAGRKYSNTAEKYTDYHYILHIVIQGLSELVRSNEGMTWHFPNVPGYVDGVSKKLFFRLAYIIGDTKGHDILCCRMGSHNNTPALCRDCNMTTQNADNPDIPCKFHKQRDLALLPPDTLKTLSFLHVENNAFKGIEFGASPYGINCATAIDIIHSVLIGLLEYLYNTFIDQLTRRQQLQLSKVVSYAATFSSRHVPGFPRTNHFKKGLFRKGIMTAKMRLARCFLVLLALKTKGLTCFLKDTKGKLPSAVSRKMKQLSKSKNDEERDSDGSINQSMVNNANNETNGDANEDDSNEEPQSSPSPMNDRNQLLEDDDIGFITCTREDSVGDDDYSGDIDEYDSEVDDSASEPSDDQDACEESDDDDQSLLDVFAELPSDDDSNYDPYTDFDARDPIVFTEEVYNNWTDLYESTLIFYRWLTMDELPCIAFKHGSSSITKHALDQFMKKYREVAYRYEGMGLKITKFHQIRHWYFYITMYGVPTNFDSSFCESHHIYLTKRTGRRTQKRQDELAQQTSQHLYEDKLLEAGMARCNIFQSVKPDDETKRAGMDCVGLNL